jgi:hypothetical protein
VYSGFTGVEDIFLGLLGISSCRIQTNDETSNNVEERNLAMG